MKKILKYLYSKIKYPTCSFAYNCNWDTNSLYGKRISLSPKSIVSESSLGNDILVENGTSIFQSTLLGKNKIHQNVRLAKSKIGTCTYIAEGAKISNTEIGNFCSIGPDVIVGYGIHPTNYISTNPIFYSSSGNQLNFTYAETQEFNEYEKIKIGNDVWIGARVIITDGITINDGAIIAAGAVVTKDVASYTVVGGVPAKFIKQRFEKSVCDAIEEMDWWHWSEEKLIAELSLFQKEVISLKALKRLGITKK